MVYKSLAKTQSPGIETSNEESCRKFSDSCGRVAEIKRRDKEPGAFKEDEVVFTNDVLQGKHERLVHT
eukprot:4736232-Amphidinium_carterae.6